MPKTHDRWALLGALRFILACIVVAEHARWVLPPNLFSLVLMLGSFAAVLGFLAISGYSIAASLDRSPYGFYRRRFRRIYPTYLLALALALAPYLFIPGALPVGTMLLPRPTLPQILGHLVFMQGFVVPVLDSDSALWSLSVEVLCYALAPLLWRLRSRFVVLLAVPSLAFFTVARGPLGLPHYAHMIYGAAFAALFWAWLAGFLFYRHRAEPRAAWAWAVLGSVALLLNRSDAPRLAPMTLVASFAALSAAPAVPLPPRLAWVCTRLGDVSYPLYLLHTPILLLLALG